MSIPDILKLIAPFSPTQLADIRMKLLEEIGTKGFQHYLDEIDKITSRIPEVLEKDELLLDDDCWKQDAIWWQKESPWLHEKYKETKLPPGVANALQIIMREKIVSIMIGTPLSMPRQQVLLFRACLLTYYSNAEALWPIMLNIDQVYQQSREKQGSMPLKEKALKIAESAASGAGPIVLKLFQQIHSAGPPGEFMGVSLKSITKRVLSDVPTLTSEELEFIIAKMNMDDALKKNMRRVPIRSGSIAQTHCTKFDNPPKGFENLNYERITDKCDANVRYPVIIKLLKPIYVYYFLCEVHFLLTVTWKFISRMVKDDTLLCKQLRQVLLFLIREFALEFNYKLEAQYTREAYDIYNKPSKSIHAIRVIHQSTSPFPMIALEAASHQPLDDLIKQLESPKEIKLQPTSQVGPTNPSANDLTQQSSVAATWSISASGNSRLVTEDEHKQMIFQLRKQVSRVLEIWVLNIFWGTGFFHADLHAGNILGPTYQELFEMVIEQKRTPDLWLIDFGSAGKLSSDMQCYLIDALLIPSRMHNFKQFVPIRATDDHGEGTAIPAQNLARFFQKYHELTPRQQEELNKKMNPLSTVSNDLFEVPELIAHHEKNVILARAFIRVIWQVCKPKLRTYDEMEFLETKILDYSSDLNFGRLFLGFVKHARDVGQCTSNATLLFGRAISYVTDMIWSLDALCHDPIACPFWTIDGVIKKAFVRHPLQLFNYTRQKPVCS
jgi:predicted unusual protein kinase regulating ubiquinone biosynthesis (AarF/ABC1/UbiB family)